MSETPVHYFQKELLSNKVWLPNGKTPNWESVGGDQGVLATREAYLIFNLKNLATKKVGGVVEINATQYEELKKNSTGPELPRSLERGLSGPMAAPDMFLQPHLQPAKPLTPVVDPVVASAGRVPVVDPAPPQKVRVGRLKRAASPSQLP